MSLHLFQGYGIELEYMIVDKDSLDVKPICDTLIHAITGKYLSEVDCGKISYSNELALHVVELKTTVPAKGLTGLENDFQEHVNRINSLLAPFHAKLAPTAAHPWMDPHREMRLWQHDHNPIYESYNRIFDCRGHGWANLQSTHINLPFCGDQEFAALHAAIRLLLPIMPALAASSPIIDGKLTDMLDTRLHVYRQNQKRIPSITAMVIPEPSHSCDHYHETILKPMYAEIAPLDPDGLLQCEWLNSRGSIARFDRSAIEIRVLDIQECAQADIAIARAISFVLQSLISNRWASLSEFTQFPVEPLFAIFMECVKNGEHAVITDERYLKIFGQKKPLTCGALWQQLTASLVEESPALKESLGVILEQGTLSSRIVRSLKNIQGKNSQEKQSQSLHTIYDSLSNCLAHGKMFLPC